MEPSSAGQSKPNGTAMIPPMSGMGGPKASSATTQWAASPSSSSTTASSSSGASSASSSSGSSASSSCSSSSSSLVGAPGPNNARESVHSNSVPGPWGSPASSACLSWSQLRQFVREQRRQSPTAHLRTPGNIGFKAKASEPTATRRLYFLSPMQPGKEATLLYVDVNPKVTGSGALPWASLIDSAFPVNVPTNTKVSKEEQLLWERKRCVMWGIYDYEEHPSSGKLLFPAAGTIYTCVDNGIPGQGGQCPHELISKNNVGARINATMCPANSDLVAFVGNGGDIWVTHCISGDEVRLTHCKKDTEFAADDPLSAGLPSYVIQEEFSRFTGFWWRPVCQGNQYHILYEEVDETDVEILRFPQSSFSGQDCEGVDEFRFPRAGTANSKSSIKMVRFEVDESGDLGSMQLLELAKPLEEAFPFMEYLVRAGWTPDGKFVWVQVMDRRQKRLELALFPIEAFVSVEDCFIEKMMDDFPQNPDSTSAVRAASSCSNGTSNMDPSLYAPQVIYSGVSDTWVCASDILTFLPSTMNLGEIGQLQQPHTLSHDDKSLIRFIWLSEETGWKHLYLITARITVPDDYACLTDKDIPSQILSKVPLTSGEWDVVDKPVCLNMERGLIYFHALMDTPLEQHLYAVSVHEPNRVRRLTTAGYSHSVALSDDCSLFASVYSSIQQYPACQVFRIVHMDNSIDGISIRPVGYVVEPKEMDKDYKCPELFSHRIKSGDTLYGMIFKPHNMVRGCKYPVVLNVYGGPDVQLVTNTFKGIRQMRNHMLASQGYCVICIDSRGSSGRGRSFEAHLRLRMGQVELPDQVEVLEWLSSVTGFMDMNRVAIHGWSYGGYLSLMGLVQFPQIFKVCVAGAPVTTWANYDTGYTERYMDLPNNNEVGYSKGSLLMRINDFPNEPNRLFIVHGVLDENVHFYNHTMKLISHLVKAGKPYQLQMYPGERHSLRHLESNEHYEMSLLWFLQSNL